LLFILLLMCVWRVSIKITYVGLLVVITRISGEAFSQTAISGYVSRKAFFLPI